MTLPTAGSLPLCPRCRRAVPPGSRFCPGCGAAQAGTAPSARGGIVRFLPWVFAAVAVLTLVALIRKPGAVAPPNAPVGRSATAPPDLSTMTPAERFDRLYQRVITAAQSGDQTTVTQFMPMAVAAFGMLDSVTIDSRYHLAMLQLHTSDLAGAQSQADTISMQNPKHLFGYVIGAAVARWGKDDAARDRAYREFMKRYDTEIATGLAEYNEHRAMLDEVKRMATAGKS